MILTRNKNDIYRQRAAMKESQKMAALQKQLSKMDEQLTVDVSTIRDEIESSSYEYNDARLHDNNL